MSFNGSSSYVDLGNPAALQITGSLTWSAWVKAAANPANDGQIIAKSDSVSGWQFKTSPDTGPHTFGFGVSSGAYVRAQRYSTTVRALNVWYHVAGVYDAAARTLDIYVNGVLDNGVLRGTIPASQVNSSVNVNIGRRTSGYYFNGIMDEVRIYNRALSAAEIQADMNTPVGISPPARASLNGISAESTLVKSIKLAIVRRSEDGRVLLQIKGPPGQKYEIEATEDMVSWKAIGNVSSATGESDFVDPEKTAASFRFYRVRPILQ